MLPLGSCSYSQTFFKVEQSQFYQPPFMCEVLQLPLPLTGLAHVCQWHRIGGNAADMVSQVANTEEESLLLTCWLLSCLESPTYICKDILGYSLLSMRIPKFFLAELLSIKLCPCSACWMRLFHPRERTLASPQPQEVPLSHSFSLPRFLQIVALTFSVSSTPPNRVSLANTESTLCYR